MRKTYYAPADAYSTQKRAYSKAVITEGALITVTAFARPDTLAEVQGVAVVAA